MQRGDTPIPTFPDEILLQFFSFLDPLALYYFARANKFFYSKIINANTLWKKNLKSHFEIELEGRLSKISNSGFLLFKKQFKQEYNQLTPIEQEIFVLVIAKDFAEIKKRQIQFTLEILGKCDAEGRPLISLIRKTGNRELMQFVFAQLVFDADILPLILIQCGIELDLGEDTEKFKSLLCKDINLDLTKIGDRNLLCYAVEYHSSKTVALLLKLNANPTLSRSDGNFPLYLAAKTNDIEILSLLLENKRTVIDQRTPIETTALCIAARQGHFDAVKLLVEHKANINGTTPGKHPFCFAMHAGNENVVNYLLENGADSTLAPYGSSPLHIAAQYNNVGCIKLLIAHQKKYGISPNLEYQTDHGSTALATAAEYNHIDVCQYLIELGAQIDNGGLFHRPLYKACEKGHFDIVKLLFENKNNLPSINVNYALQQATLYGDINIVKFLLEQPNCDVNYPAGVSPLYHACNNGNLAIAKLLIEHKANVNSVQRGHRTPLYIAAKEGYGEILDLLIAQGALVDIADEKGLTPLAAAYSNLSFPQAIPVISSLIRAGVNPETNFKIPLTTELANDRNWKSSKLKKLIGYINDFVTACPITEIVCADTSFLPSRDVINTAITHFQKREFTNCGQANICRDLLANTFTPLGAAIALYVVFGIIHSEASFTPFLTQTLGYKSQQAAKNDLLSIILSSMKEIISYDSFSFNQSLFTKLDDTIIQPLVKILKDHDYKKDSLKFIEIMLTLNLVEAQYKKAADLMAQKKDEINLAEENAEIKNYPKKII